MKRQAQTQSCPVCGSVMVYERRDDLIEYRGHERTIKTLGFWCNNCGEGILTGKPLLASEKAYLAFKAEVDELERRAATAGETLARSRRARRRSPMSERLAAMVIEASANPIILAPEEIAHVRKKLRLSQKRASELLGGEHRAFHEYESGKVPISVPMSNLLRLLDNDPTRLEELTGPALVKAPRTSLPSKTPAHSSEKPRTVVAVSQSDVRSPRRSPLPVGRSRATTRRTGTDS